MTKTQATRLLRDALAHLYATSSDAERIVADAELTLTAIAYDNKSLNRWHNILSEAEKQQKVRMIIEIARAEYPKHEALTQASAAYLAATGGTLAANATDLAKQGPLAEEEDAGEQQALHQLLAQHQRNLQLLQTKKAVYGAGEEPLSLLNQIAHEEQEIARLKRALDEANKERYNLDPAIGTELLKLLTSLMEDENSRRLLLTAALGRNATVLRRITWSGNVETFILRTAGLLAEVGEIESGKQALWALLEAVYNKVDVDQQKRIDRLHTVINTSPQLQQRIAQIDNSNQRNMLRQLRVLLSSPEDVADERAIAVKLIEQLSYDPLLRGRVIFETIEWNKFRTHSPVLAAPLRQAIFPERIVNPSDFDIVIVILWSQIGAPLPLEFTIADASRFLSASEWVYENATQTSRQSGRPFVVVYRRMEKLWLDPDSNDYEQKLEQWQHVKSFFAKFAATGVTDQQGYNTYETPSEFRATLEIHLKYIIRQILEEDTWKPANQLRPPSLVAASSETPSWEGSPFPGLRSLGPKDAPIFFGRESETDDLVARLMEPECRFLAVVGASGSGKSSIVGAGLLPRLMDNALEGSKDWMVVRFTPDELGNGDPFASLAAALMRDLSSKETRLAAKLKENPSILENIGNETFSNCPASAEIILFIDQFEELFTLVGANYCGAFVDLLAHIAASNRMRLIVTLRADFYAQCVEWPVLARLLRKGSYPLAAPRLAALYQMIARPAAHAGLRFEPGLAERILEDTGIQPGSLALMAYALDELYQASLSSDGWLTYEAYQALGGVQGAIGKRAESTFMNLSENVRNALPYLFRELVEVDERGIATRQRVRFDKIIGNKAVEQLIEALTQARLLVSSQSEDKGSAILEVAHEALLHSWPRLAGWIQDTQDDLRLLRQVRLSAKEWADNNRDPSFRWPDERLRLVYKMTDRLGIVTLQEFDEMEQDFIRRELDRLLEELKDPTITHHRRSAIGERLNTIGDSRSGVGLCADRLPDIVWCRVGEKQKIRVEVEGKDYLVSPFHIAKYPVTYQQFQLFIEDNGYEVDEWWAQLARRLEKPREQRFKFDNHPRETISWYEAVAYCHWLSSKLGYTIRLPTEAEWLAAATLGDANRVYPWGSEWLDGCANTSESGLSRAVAVGIYTRNVSPCGAMDMSGNVEEWTLTEYDTGQSSNISNDNRRVLHGGSWNSDKNLSQVIYRFRSDPSFRNYNIGFRLCTTEWSEPEFTDNFTV